MTEDEKQIAEAKTDIAKKGADSQTEKDRIDESVGEQERLDGNKDSQTAKDRVDESEGTKKAYEERAEDRVVGKGCRLARTDGAGGKTRRHGRRRCGRSYEKRIRTARRRL